MNAPSSSSITVLWVPTSGRPITGRVADGIAVGYPSVSTHRERINQPKPGKAGEVAVGRRKNGAVLDGERGEVGVHHKRPTDLARDQEFAQNLPMPGAG